MRWRIPFSVINAKGGVGKTTSAVNIATFAANSTKPDGSNVRVLLIDVDPQNNATQQIGYNDLSPELTLAGHVERDADLAPLIIQNACDVQGLSLLPSHYQLNYVDRSVLERGTWLRRKLRGIIEDYDLVIFDCPADLDIFTTNALAASQGVLIPTQAEKHSVTGLPHLIACARQIFEETECGATWAYILITMFSKNNSVERNWRKAVRDQYADIVLEAEIRRNTDIEKAVTSNLPLMLYDDKCAGYLDYQDVTKEMLALFAEMQRPQLTVVELPTKQAG